MPFTQCQALVRFFALRRIKPHTPPLVRAPVNSFESRTTGVSNPVRSPGFRASASAAVQEAAFATGVLPDIYAFHRYTRNSASLSRAQETRFPSHHGAEPRTFRKDLRPRLRPLYAQ